MLISFELLETIVVLYGPKKPFLLRFCLYLVSVRHNSYLSIQCFQQHDYCYHLRHIFIVFSSSNTSTNKTTKIDFLLQHHSYYNFNVSPRPNFVTSVSPRRESLGTKLDRYLRTLHNFWNRPVTSHILTNVSVLHW